MEGLFTHAEKPLEQIEQCAVAIVGNAVERHTGFFYRDPDDNKVVLLHLQTDNLHVVDAATERSAQFYLRASPAIHKRRHGDLAAKAYLVYKRNSTGRVPYGFSCPTNFFIPDTGEINLSHQNNIGLTCATLLLAIFHMAGYQLVDYSSWKPRYADLIPQQKLLANLIDLEKIKRFRDTGITSKYIDAVKKQMTAIRFRPEEVIAAAVTAQEINTMDQLEPLGYEIVQQILTNTITTRGK